MMVVVGQTVYFDPFLYASGYGADIVRGNYVKGTVVMTNYAHHWFSVEYGDPKQRTSFNFSDIGKTVTVCG